MPAVATAPLAYNRCRCGRPAVTEIEGYDALVLAQAAVTLDRDVIRAAGPDAVSYLQGQLSQDVDGLEVGRSAWSLVLQPQGKVDAWMRVTRVASDEFLLDLDG